ncbi:Polyketide synthase, KR, partial [Ostreococcus tauri]
SVFVTGGLGALGQTSAAWYAHRGVRHAYLTGRRGRGESPLLRWASGGQPQLGALHIIRVDACASDEVSYGGEYAYARTHACGVLHAGGVLRDALTARQSASAHRHVWSSKVASAHALLDYCVSGARGAHHTALFSSVASLLGNSGQCNYSAANGALDATAAREWRRGTAVRAVQWGAWDGAGMALSNPAVLGHARASGIGVLDPRAGLAAVRVALHESMTTTQWWATGAVLAVVPFQWTVLSKTHNHTSALVAEYRTKPAASTDVRATVSQKGATGARPASDESVRQLVTSAVARALGRDVSSDASLMEEGLDSLAAVELGGALQRDTGVTMPATLAFDYPTITAICGFVLLTSSSSGYFSRQTSSEVETSGFGIRPTGPDTSNRESLAAVPSYLQAEYSVDVNLYISSLAFAQKSETPSAHHFSGEVQCVFGGTLAPLYDDEDRFQQLRSVHFGHFIQQVDFELRLFQIPFNEWRELNVQQLMLIETVFESLKRYNSNRNSAYGVVVGATASQITANDVACPSAYMGISSALSVLCGRVSYTFGLRGPSVCVDTACSSSLVAAHTASAYLRGRECDDALVAGVSVNVGVGTLLLAAAASMLSYDGRCKTLDASADGYAKGECCVVLRVTSNTSLDVDALARDANDPSPTHIALAQLEHTGVNQDGRSSSLTAPNGPSQQALMADVLVRAGLHARTIGRLEMHGTGTSLGDPIEVGAALEVLASPSMESQPSSARALTFEGAKPRVGHCEPGAGVVGLLFATAHVTTRATAALVHLRQLNPHVEAAARRHAQSQGARHLVLPRQGM